VLLSKGTPFWQAGEEMLRTKPDGNGGYDHNSYMSSDAVNNIDWSVLDGESRQYQTMVYYKGLIELRKTFKIFSNVNTQVTAEKGVGGMYVVTFSDGNGGVAKVVINPLGNSFTQSLGGTYTLVATSDAVDVNGGMGKMSSVSVDSISIRVYVNDVLLNNR
jgi:pullulanase